MKSITGLRFVFFHLVHDWKRSSLTLINLILIICIYLVTAAFVVDLKNFGLEILNVPQTLFLMSRYALMPSDSRITTLEFHQYTAAIRNQFGDSAIQRENTKIYRQLFIDGQSIPMITFTMDETKNNQDFTLMAGNWPSNPQEIIVSAAYITLSGKSIGDSVLIYGSPFQISGILTSQRWSSAIILMPLDQAQALYSSGEVFQLGFIQIGNQLDADQVQEFLLEKFPEGACCAVYQDDHFVGLYRDMVKDIHVLAKILQIIVLCLISFGTYNGSVMVINEHNREIALLRVVGFNNKQVNWILFLRFNVLLLIGYFGGYCLALGLSTVYIAVNQPVISGNLLQLTITWQDLLFSFGLTVLFSGAGVWLALKSQNVNTIHKQMQTVFSGRVG